MKNNATIIMYHYVRDMKQSKFPDIKGLDAALFAEQIKYLVKYYTFITMDQLIDSIDNKTPLPSRAVLLSFDDGYTDHYDCVLPVLKKHKIQGSFYPPAKAILEAKVLDVNKIHFILASVADKSLLTKEIYSELDKYREQYELESNESYYEKHAVAKRRDTAEVMFIKQMLQVVLPETVRLKICDRLFNKYVTSDEAAFSRELYMSVDQFKELNNQGMHIGSHGYDHYWLGSLSKEKQEIEIDRSLDFLKLVGCDLNRWTMCYPYGNFNDDTLSILNDRNCKLALTTKTGIANINAYGRFELPRLDTNEIPVNATADTNKWYEMA